MDIPILVDALVRLTTHLGFAYGVAAFILAIGAFLVIRLVGAVVAQETELVQLENALDEVLYAQVRVVLDNVELAAENESNAARALELLNENEALKAEVGFLTTTPAPAASEEVPS